MRLALVSVIVLAGLVPTAFAQPAATDSPPPPPPPPPASAEPAAAPAAAPAPEAAPAPPPAAEAAPPATAPPAAAAAAPASPPSPAVASPPPPPPPPAAAPGAAPPTTGAETPAPPPAPEPAPQIPTGGGAITEPAPPPSPPEPPPPPPTDPTAIAAVSILEKVCIPAVAGGNWDALSKAAGLKRARDAWVLKGPTYQFTVNPPGSNPHSCIVDITHPVDPDAPAKPVVVALHNWAAVTRGWSLYRNDKGVVGAAQITTRSWENSADGKNEALVITTFRKADGSPAKPTAETSQMIYSVNKTPG
jgi:hypothetical protein